MTLLIEVAGALWTGSPSLDAIVIRPVVTH